VILFESLDEIKNADLESKRILKILWHGVSSACRSGYGTVTRYVAGGLHRLGYDIIVSAYYGVEEGGVLLIDGLPTLPCTRRGGDFGRISCLRHYKGFRRNLCILMSDFWAFPWMPTNIENSLMYSPMDQIDYGVEWQQLIKQYRWVVPLCYFQKEELDKYGIKCEDPIYHGVDTTIFHPRDRRKAREFAKLNDEDFVIGMVGANADHEGRKGWVPAFKALGHFLRENPDVRDVRLVVHANPDDPRGLRLKNFARKYGILDICGFEDPELSVIGLGGEELSLLYNSFDVLLHPSFREGFGLCILESMACGTPVIGHDFSSMTELIKGRGWLCKTGFYLDTRINAVTGIPDHLDLANKIKDAYFNDKQRSRFAKKALEFARQYDWKILLKDKWVPLLEKVARDIKEDVESPKVKEIKI